MAFPNNTQTPIAVSNFSQQDLSCQHVTTADFMQINIAKAMEIVPRQRVNINMDTFARLEPLAVPTFGRASIKNRAYFVPYRTVFPLFNDFINDVPSVSGTAGNTLSTVVQITHVPMINNQVFTQLFRGNSYSTSAADAESADFTYIVYSESGAGTDVSTTEYRKFTDLGRQSYKLLRSLGYAPDFTNRSSLDSALQLFSFCRIFLDFYYPSQYANDSDSAWLTALLRSDFSTSDTVLSIEQLRLIFPIITKLAYPSDYFTSAWDNPNAPNSQLASSVDIPDVNQMTTSMDENDVPTAAEYNTTKTPNAPITESSRISQFTLSALRALTDYMKRHQIAGSRVLDRYLSRFGIKLQSERINRSVFIGESHQDIQFGDVTSTASTDGATLGAYAGKAISYGQGNFSFEAEEYGMIIIVSVITPAIQYFQGVNRHVKHLTKLDFYTPEFDNLGTQAIGCNEVYVPMHDGVPVGYNEKIFGFVPRYAEYKVPYSQITGDYILNSLNTGKDSWTLFRDLAPYVSQIGGLGNLRHSIDFVRGTDANQYNRIFKYVGTGADHINVIHNFQISSSFPGKSLFDTYEYENEDKAQNVTMEIGGTTHS